MKLTSYVPEYPIDQPYNSSALFSSETEEWYTPPLIIRKVLKTIDHIDVDPCADPNKTIPAAIHYRIQDNGLSKDWLPSQNIFMNPPYGRGRIIDPWIDKWLAYTKNTDPDTASIILVPARTDTYWFHRVVEYPLRYRGLFVKGRIRFTLADYTESLHGAPFPSLLVYHGQQPQVFDREFGTLGYLFTT